MNDLVQLTTVFKNTAPSFIQNQRNSQMGASAKRTNPSTPGRRWENGL